MCRIPIWLVNTKNVATVPIDGTEVTLSQNPGRNAMASWTRNEFDYLLLCEEPQMNLLGGVIQDFVTQTTASTVSGSGSRRNS